MFLLFGCSRDDVISTHSHYLSMAHNIEQRSGGGDAVRAFVNEFVDYSLRLITLLSEDVRDCCCC